MAKLFLSFLGTNDYSECKYKINDGEGRVVKYIQERLIEKFCRDWTENDKIFIFLTNEAKKKNWNDNGHFDYSKKEQKKNKGLEKCLKDLNLKCQIIPVDIPDGKSEEEMWEIFDKINDKINVNDEIILDITHSFRSLPFYLSIFLNYAKVLKKIQIKGIYYGAFEAQKKSPELNKEEIIAPVFDLTKFAYLQDWTFAINNFINYGVPTQLVSLIKDFINLKLNETKGNDEIAKKLSDFKNILKNLYNNILLCRGRNIINFNFNYDEFENLVEELNVYDLNLTPLKPLMKDLIKKIKPFKKNDINNLKYAGDWCLEYNYYQQAITFYFEYLITYIASKCNIEDYTKIQEREFVAYGINKFIHENQNNNFDDKYKKEKPESEKIKSNIEQYEGRKQELEKIKSIIKQIKNFDKIYNNINNCRNDVNHCGMRESPMNIDTIKNKINQFKEILP